MQDIINNDKNVISPCKLCKGCAECTTPCAQSNCGGCGKCCQKEIIYDLYDSEVVATFDPKDLEE